MLVFRYDYGMTLVKFDKKNITDCYRCGAMYGEATGKTALQKKPQSLTPLTQTHLHTQQLMPSMISMARSFMSASESLSSDFLLDLELSDLVEGVGDGV